jgi:5-methylcytosine-specific restriction endonuclease McrA
MSKFNQPMRNMIKKRANYYCEICGKDTLDGEVHHIIPRFLGGVSELNNGCYLCRTCHIKLHNKLRKELIKFVKENSMLWKKYNGGEI